MSAEQLGLFAGEQAEAAAAAKAEAVAVWQWAADRALSAAILTGQQFDAHTLTEQGLPDPPRSRLMFPNPQRPPLGPHRPSRLPPEPPRYMRCRRRRLAGRRHRRSARPPTIRRGPAMTTPLALLTAGHPLDEIAERLGYPDTKAAAAAVRAEIDRTAYGDLPELLAVHLLRLDALSAVLTDRDDLADTERVYASRLLDRVDRLRSAALARFVADALRQADKGRQIGGQL